MTIFFSGSPPLHYLTTDSAIHDPSLLFTMYIQTRILCHMLRGSLPEVEVYIQITHLPCPKDQQYQQFNYTSTNIDSMCMVVESWK